MSSFRFRPTLDGLEDRSLMSVTPEQVVAAYTRTVQTTDELRELLDTLGRPRTTQTIQFLASHLPEVADQSRADAQVLAEYRLGLEQQLAANPALIPLIGQFTGGIGYAEYEATINALYADFFATGFGAPPPAPPPPPPFAPTPPDFGVEDDLPFALDDPGFQTLASGVRVWDVTTGTGPAVAVNDEVSLNYTGYLTDGTVFDSSLDPNQPFETTLNTANLIPGFVEGVTGMQPGGVRRVFIPAALAYGSQERPGIPANSDLVFEITLLSSP